ncbi:hypothetical protein D9756_000888 [Leucocoprinus leucothites]|uniref:Altered inheritance of mitochondria protein 23, mitochondrial n=1 Tax=Leucocoprinus leucothites TaxID=201217 RepID=A0A8H5GF25_9AGAR|nr:hypothetical protein D9756_000888 [Leucoagaricus leucothites]
MSTFSAFRSIAVELLYLNSRPNIQQVLPRLSLGSIDPSRIPNRHFHASHLRRGWVKNSQLVVKGPEAEERKRSKERKKKEIGLKDRDIPYKRVQVSSPQGLSEPRTLQDVLMEVESLNALVPGQEPGDQDQQNKRKALKRYYTQLVANDPVPIVKIVNSYEEFKKQKAAQERSKNNAVHNVRKEVQLTWASSGADVETKLEKMQEDLNKGFKVDLAIMPKKKMLPPRREDMQQRADELVAHFSGTAKEWKERDYTKTTVVIYFQGTSSSMATVVDDGVKKPKKLLVKEQRRQILEEKMRKKQELEARSRDHLEQGHGLSL